MAEEFTATEAYERYAEWRAGVLAYASLPGSVETAEADASRFCKSYGRAMGRATERLAMCRLYLEEALCAPELNSEEWRKELAAFVVTLPQFEVED